MLFRSVLFVAQLLGFVALSVIALMNLSESNSTGGLGQSGGSSITLNRCVPRLRRARRAFASCLIDAADGRSGTARRPTSSPLSVVRHSSSASSFSRSCARLRRRSLRYATHVYTPIRAKADARAQITLLLSVVLSVAYAIYLWTQKYWSGAVIFTLVRASLVGCQGRRQC